MTCAQCSRPAFYVVGDGEHKIPLCLPCLSMWQDINFKQWLQAAATLNQALDNADWAMPIAPSRGRIPVAEIARAAASSRTYNNIHITNSSVGVVNTGHLARINAAIELSRNTEREEFGARLKDLAEAIVNSKAIDDQLREQMVEVVTAISDQAASKSPSNIVVTTLFDRLKQLASGTAAIVGAIEKLHDAWVRFQAYLNGT